MTNVNVGAVNVCCSLTLILLACCPMVALGSI